MIGAGGQATPGADTTAPTVPTNITASNITTTGFTLNWTASTDAVGVTGYDVQIGGTLYATSTTTSVSVTGRAPATGYSVQVRAFDAAGNYSALSSAVTVTTSTPTATFYLDPTSSAGSSLGTLSAPWKFGWELGDNSASFIPGSVLYVKRGTTVTGKAFLTSSGTQTQPIAVLPYGDVNAAQPKFANSDDVNFTLGSSGSTTQGSWWILNDLDFDNGNWSGLRLYGSHNTVQNCTLQNSVAGVHVEGLYSRILSCVIRNNNRMSVNTPTNVNPNDDSGAFGVLLGSGASNSEVAYCTISGHLASSYDYGFDGCAVEISGPSNCYVHHNTAFDNETFTELAGSNNTGNVFEWNVMYGSYAGAKALVTRGYDGTFGPTLATQFNHNSVYFPGATSGGLIVASAAGVNLLSATNNVIRAAHTVQTDGPITENNNVLYGTASFAGSQTLNATSANTDPLFVSTTDLHLQAGSPGISRSAGAYA